MSFAFNIPFQVVKVDPEEAMYKELFIGMVMDSLPSVCVIPADITDVKRVFCFVTSTVTDITFEGLTVNPTLANNVLYAADQCKIVRTPNLTRTNSSLFQSGNSVEDWYAPKLEAFSSMYVLNATSKAAETRIHIEKTCEQILAMQWFPWTNQETVRQKLKFVGTNGTLSWDGSTWVKS